MEILKSSNEIEIEKLGLIRDAFKKKTSYGGKSSLPVLPPPPPTKVGNKTLGNFLVVLDPLPPYKSREIYSFL